MTKTRWNLLDATHSRPTRRFLIFFLNTAAEFMEMFEHVRTPYYRFARSHFWKQSLARLSRPSPLWATIDLTAAPLPPVPMSFTAVMLLSAKGGAVRGCLSGSRWLNSALLVSIPAALPTSPGSVAIFLLLPAPGARSKWSSMTIDFDLSTALDWKGDAVNDAEMSAFTFLLKRLWIVTGKRSLSGRHIGFSSAGIWHSKYTQLLATSFNNKLAAAQRQGFNVKRLS